MALIRLNAQKFNKKMRGRVIDRIDFNALPDGRGGISTSPVIHFMDKSRMHFTVQETEDEYGIAISFYDRGTIIEFGEEEGK